MQANTACSVAAKPKAYQETTVIDYMYMLCHIQLNQQHSGWKVHLMRYLASLSSPKGFHKDLTEHYGSFPASQLPEQSTCIQFLGTRPQLTLDYQLFNAPYFSPYHKMGSQAHTPLTKQWASCHAKILGTTSCRNKHVKQVLSVCGSQFLHSF